MTFILSHTPTDFAEDRSHRPYPTSDESNSEIELVDTANSFQEVVPEVCSLVRSSEQGEITHSPATEPRFSGINTQLDVVPAVATTEQLETLPADILEALGEAKGKLEVLGPKIQEEVSERWGRIMTEGLNKDQKRILLDKLLVPENFTLVKAPKLNPEIGAVLSESARNRDKHLERSQHHLGLGIAGLTNVISTLIGGDLEKLDIIKKLSEVNQVLIDLHFENTVNRRRLITPILDKKFLSIVQDTKRDSFLFGETLGEKIKASKTVEKSGLQIKKSENKEPFASKKYSQLQGNWRGPPRRAQRGGRSERARNRTFYQTSRRTGPPTGRDQTSKAFPRTSTKNQ